MNKKSIKTFAIWARRELINRVTQKAFEYGVEKDNIIDFNANSINGRILTADEKIQRQQLINEVNKKGFDQVIEEVAYTWFNRFIALRYMEVNNYLPNKIRIFTNENNEFKPQILDEAINIDLPGLDQELVFNLLESNDKEELYKQLIVATCNDMGNYLPGMFTNISDYKVLLFPDNILRNENVLGRLISDIEEDSWTQQVEIIGWLYQYYISERHDEAIDPLYGSGITKDEIAPATQLFTPDWIVKYMVDNSLGRYLIENFNTKFLLDKLNYLSCKDYEFKSLNLNFEELKFLDPCMGSGHILVYAFDIFMQIYCDNGYSEREAARLIIENNLYGIDIDERAYQLAYFALMMKARKYNRTILSKSIKTNLYYFTEPRDCDFSVLEEVNIDCNLLDTINYLVTLFYDSKEIGSLLMVDKKDYKLFIDNLALFKINDSPNMNDIYFHNEIKPMLLYFGRLAEILSNKYDIVCTNPPYLNKQPKILREYVLKYYADFSADLFSCFIKRNLDFCKSDGYSSYMTPNVWMFIQSFEKVRDYIINNLSITSFLQLAKGSYKEATVDICTFVLSNKKDIKGNYIRLTNYPATMEEQKKALLNYEQLKSDFNIHHKFVKQFKQIPNFPIAFWLQDDMLNTFNNILIDNISISKAGIVSGKDPLFLRYWYEVNINDITLDAKNFDNKYAYKYVPINKGGNYKRWYGNNEWVINIYDIWNSNKVNKSVRRSDPNYYFKKSITWSYVTSGIASFRISENAVSSTAAPSLFFNNDDDLYYTLGIINTPFAENYFTAFNDTLNLNVTNVSSMPYIEAKNKQDIVEMVKENIKYCKNEYDMHETSINFKKSPLLMKGHKYLKDCYHEYFNIITNLRNMLLNNETKISNTLIQEYGLTNIFNYRIPEKSVSIKISDCTTTIKEFISYAVGCMFGRYSLDIEGLAYAGGEWNENKYKSFVPDKDNIIPICSDEYFEDDIVNRFVKFVEVVYGKETLEANLKFITDALNGKGTPREVLRQYFLNDFFKDHCNTYQVSSSGKRPIYWLFDSGKKNGFKALIYIHRYTPDLIARMRTQYIHEQQSRYRNQIELLENQINNGVSTSERVRLNKKLKKLKEQDEELRKYEEKIHHWADKMEPMDLDDGVKVNYDKFQELLAKIK